MADRFSVLVADPLAEEGLALLRGDARFDFVVKTGESEDSLAGLVGQHDGLVVRSGVKITARVLANPGKLRVIARAGVGVDNIDLEAATRHGVLVLNTPDANTLSTAEHTMAMMLAAARQIPQAHQHVAQGGWERGKFKGIQLAGKTLAIIGFGRIGRAIAARALALNMTVIAHDPMVADESALGGRVRMIADKIETLKQADIVTLHAALTEQTKYLIDAAALSVMKPSAILINCARGELVDEVALFDALQAKRLAGAALDVFSKEPPTGNPLIGHPNVVHTPHLGASTVEAQRAVSVDAVAGVMDFLRDGVIRSAVNAIDLPHDLSPLDVAYVDLADRIGRLLAPFCGGGLRQVRVATRGESLGRLAMWLGRHIMVRLIGQHLTGPVSVVNVLDLAAQRSIRFEASATSQEGESIVVRIETAGGSHSVEGCVVGDKRPRIRQFNGYSLDMVPEGHMVVLTNDDRPGVIGLTATALGSAGVNIADLAVSRQGSDAMMVFRIDAPMPPALIDELRSRNPPIRSVYAVELPPLQKA